MKDDYNDWPYCKSSDCLSRCCKALRSELCFPHLADVVIEELEIENDGPVDRSYVEEIMRLVMQIAGNKQ